MFIKCVDLNHSFKLLTLRLIYLILIVCKAIKGSYLGQKMRSSQFSVNGSHVLMSVL